MSSSHSHHCSGESQRRGRGEVVKLRASLDWGHTHSRERALTSSNAWKSLPWWLWIAAEWASQADHDRGTGKQSKAAQEDEEERRVCG
jgi:hypothetical protein